MLAQTLFLVAMIGIIAFSSVAGIAGYARAETASAAKALVQPSIDEALARYESSVIAPAIANAAVGDGSASPAAIPALNGGLRWNAQQYVLTSGGTPMLAASISVTPTVVAVPACRPAGTYAAGGPDVQIDGQCSNFTQESRLSIAIVADVGPPSGTTSVSPLAHGVQTVTLRLFAQPPYVMTAGVTDDPAPGDPHEGDEGGFGNALGAFGPEPGPDDTTIHVIFACTPALGDCNASHPPPQDDPTSLPWTNGNTPASG